MTLNGWKRLVHRGERVLSVSEGALSSVPPDLAELLRVHESQERARLLRARGYFAGIARVEYETSRRIDESI